MTGKQFPAVWIRVWEYGRDKYFKLTERQTEFIFFFYVYKNKPALRKIRRKGQQGLTLLWNQFIWFAKQSN